MKSLLAFIVSLLLFSNCIHSDHESSGSTSTESRIDSLINIMTLDEKLGQLNVVAYASEVTGPGGQKVELKTALQKGQIGGIQNIGGVETLKPIQEMAINESRLGIPLLFPADIIHGREIVFPIPLAEAASWDLEAIELSTRIAATEAASEGINMTFAPVADVARDPRWGRIMEGGGEDPYLTSKIVAARVKGFQGGDLGSPFTLLACAKHFAAYGAAEGGRDYNIVDMSERRLREIYLPPFKSAVDAGIGSFMVSFNEINGTPSSSNSFLLRQVLKGEWGFKGFVIGDYTSVGELVAHGVAKDISEAAELAMNAGVDVDLVTQAYLYQLPELVKEGKVREETINDAVRRVLRMKYALGIMDDPFRYLDQRRSDSAVYRKAYHKIARDIALESIVLLKNEDHVLPLPKSGKTIALIGPFVDNNFDPIGEWAFGGSHYEDVISLLDGVKQAVPDATILYAKGCETTGNDKSNFDLALATARKADVVVVALGEPISMIGEGHSRTHLDLPGVQLDLLKQLNKTGKPIIAVLLNGRPLLLDWLEHNIPAIVEAWHLGHESGHAIADVLFGNYNPSGKLTVSFPLSVGQIPVYYSYKTTGRPYQKNLRWCSHYIDSPNDPLYPFGYGMSYTNYEYADITLNKQQLFPDDTLHASITIKNVGDYDGTEIVQLYIRDLVGSVTRPVKELKGFQRVFLAKGEEKVITFSLTEEDLRFYDKDMQYVAEPGDFTLFIGKNSKDTESINFVLKD